MPGAAPVVHKIAQVTGDNKVVIEGFNAELDVVPKGQQLTEGQEIRGWLNEEGKYGPYIKVAEDRPNTSQTRSNGSSQAPRDDATGRSIERQVAGKIAGELTSAYIAQGKAWDKPAFVENFHFLVDTIHDAIKGTPDDSDIPFS